MLLAEATPGAYDPSQPQWLPITGDDAPGVELERLTVVTFNVWFEAHHFDRRGQALVELLETCDADLIALQEVTPPLLKRLMGSGWVRARYQLSDIYGGSVDPYGVLILSRLPVAAWRLHALPSAMGRMLLCAQVRINGSATTLATVHLESLRHAAPTRAKQLARIFPLLAPDPHALLVGDFNFCSSWAGENSQIDPRYQDVWPLLRPSDPGYTMHKNPMHPKQVRFDRILLRSARPGWRPATIQVLGDTPIAPELPQVFPSDHLGLRATFVWERA